MLKLKNAPTKILLAILGAVYLNAFSNLEINIFLKGYAAIVPVQLLALVYGIYVISQKQSKNRQYSSK